MKHRLSINLAAFAAFFAIPIACFASAHPVVFAAITEDPGKLGIISLLATIGGLVIKHVVPADKINKIIPWAGVIGGAVLGPKLGPHGNEIINVVLGGLAGAAPTVGHQLLVKRTPLKNIQVPKWWTTDESQGL